MGRLIPAVPTRIAEPIAVERRPAIDGALRGHVLLRTDVAQLAGADRRRSRLLIIARDHPLYVGTSAEAAAGPMAARLPAGQVMEIRHTGAVWARSDPPAGELTRINLVPNPSFENDVAGWNTQRGTVVRSTAQVYAGAASALYTVTDTSGANVLRTDASTIPVEAGATYTAQGRVRMSTPTNRSFILYIIPRQADGVTLAGSSIPSASQAVTDAGWVHFHVTGVIPANAVYADVYVQRGGAIAVGDAWHVDGVMLEKTAEVNPSYFDGSTPGASWTGAAHNSPSTMPVPAPNLVTVAAERWAD